MRASRKLEAAKNSLAQKGYRKAATRDVLLRLFFSKKRPLSAPLLLSFFRKNNLGTNKTTVYRQLEALEKERIIERVEMGDSQKWYEASHFKHHHHIVCEGCGCVRDMDIPKKVERFMNQLAEKRGFKAGRHAFEFFGLCAKCKTNI